MKGTAKSILNHFDGDRVATDNGRMVLFDTYGNLKTKPTDKETASIIMLVSGMRWYLLN